MTVVKDAGSSRWQLDVQDLQKCQVPWWVWQLEVEPGDPVPVAIGRNKVSLGASRTLEAHREEPLCRYLPLRPYEVSQLSMVTFLVGFVVVLRTGVPSLVAALALSFIPICRICPELPLLRSWPRGSKSLRVVLWFCLCIWIVLLVLFQCRLYRSTPALAAPEVSPAREAWRPPAVPAMPAVELPTRIDVPVEPDLVPRHQPPCFWAGAKYVPNMPGQGRSRVNSASECQARCFRTPGCAYFTMSSPSPGIHWCHLQEYGSRRIAAAQAVAGPSDCEQEAMLADVGDLDPDPAPTTQAVVADRPAIDWPEEPQVARAPSPLKVVKQEPAKPVPDVGADGSLFMLLLVVGAAGAVAISGKLERSG
ncbi:unnamed protein product [Effrenium voratum]|nr:unnamed protein product [Effrenium voratum]